MAKSTNNVDIRAGNQIISLGGNVGDWDKITQWAKRLESLETVTKVEYKESQINIFSTYGITSMCKVVETPLVQAT